MSIKVLLVDDHQIMREGLSALLAKAEDIEVIAEAASGNEAVDKTLDLKPDVVIMDLTLPEISGIEAIKQILQTAPGQKILALSMLEEKSCVVESLKAGAKGYLVKNCAARELIQAIRTLAAGDSYLCSQITSLIIQDYSREGGEEAPKPADPTLTEREIEVLRRIASGQSTKEIAFALSLSTKTVDVHRSRIMKKLDLHSIAELTKYAIREGLASLK
jgi:DNA-binding NarL/FixJ family response regulator